MLTRGFSLIEIVVAIVLAGLVFGVATSSMLRQQRAATRARSLTDVDLQATAAIALLGSQLSELDRGVDVATGEARDTSLEFRAPIIASVSCASASGTVTIASDSAIVAFTGSVAAPKAGDSLFWRSDSTWKSSQIIAVGSATIVCTNPGVALTGAFRLTISRPDTVPILSPIRITRPTRYSIYKSSDGTWQLGFREATGLPLRFAAPQPVIGPLVLKNGTRHSGFRYFDSSGVELVPGTSGAPVPNVARVRVSTWLQVASHSAGQDSLRVDSLDVSFQHAHGP